MKFPKFLKVINKTCAIIAGVLVCCIALLATFEAFMRHSGNPTVWSSDVTLYMLLYAVFLSSAYAFQEKGHVAVDFVQLGIGKAFGKKAQKSVAVFCYLVVEVFVAVLLWASTKMFISANFLHKMTFATIRIPITILYGAMVFGSVLMAITVLFIILDLTSSSDKYI